MTFLRELSSVPLPDAVVRLVGDSATQQAAVQIINAPTVIVVNDPADLRTLLGVKALKLTKVTDTVAVTEVAVTSARNAIERKGFTPQTVSGTKPDHVRSSTTDAAAAVMEAERLKRLYAGRAGNVYERHAATVTERARQLADVDARVAVTKPLTLTRAALKQLDGSAS